MTAYEGDPLVERLVGREHLGLARAQIERMTLADLVAHHANLSRELGYAAGLQTRVELIEPWIAAAEKHRKAWLAAGQPRLPKHPIEETVDSLDAVAWAGRRRRARASRSPGPSAIAPRKAS